MPVKEVTELDVLRKAHELVLDGWTKGVSEQKFPNNRVGYCAWGAIYKASIMLTSYRGTTSRALEQRAVDVLKDFVPNDKPLTKYNDESRRTLADISDLFLDAIEWLEEEG